jgi:hypothetical protein
MRLALTTIWEVPDDFMARYIMFLKHRHLTWLGKEFEQTGRQTHILNENVDGIKVVAHTTFEILELEEKH